MLQYERRLKVQGQQDAAALRQAIGPLGGTLIVDEVFDDTFGKPELVGQPHYIRFRIPAPGDHYSDESDGTEAKVLALLRRLDFPDWEETFCSPYRLLEGDEPIGQLQVFSPQGMRDLLEGEELHCGQSLDLLVPRAAESASRHEVTPWRHAWIRVRYELAWAPVPATAAGTETERQPVLYLDGWAASSAMPIPEGAILRWPRG